MIRHFFRLLGFAACTGVVFCAFALLFGYLAIGVWNLHAPLPKASELAVHFAAVTTFMFPGVVGLSLVGLLMAWSSAISVGPRLLFFHSLGSGLALAVLVTLEELPRSSFEWLAYLMPVAPILSAFVPVRAWASRRRNEVQSPGQRAEHRGATG